MARARTKRSNATSGALSALTDCAWSNLPRDGPSIAPRPLFRYWEAGRGNGAVPAGRLLYDVRTWSLWGLWPAVAIANPEGWAIENTMDLSLIDCQHDRKAFRAELRPQSAPISDDDSRFLENQ